MDFEHKVLLSMKVFNNCTLKCCVSCTSQLIPKHENEEILIVDYKGVAHKAIVNFCPKNVCPEKTITITEFIDIFVKIQESINIKSK